jgi:N6-L-threonylcarbamoyladenine synthase
MPNNVIIAIETSCDDTSMSLFVNGKLHHQITKSTLKEMRKFGGIVPEIASRGHCQVIDEIFNELIKKTNLDVSNITHIAYTAMPGLPGSLHIGKIYAKSLAYLLDVELIPINHMYGHIFSFAIENEELIKFPFISFIASGGHTTIYLVKSLTDIQILNTSSDDAIGEVLDKIGRNLGLEYPGGISIDKIYDENKTDLKLIDHFPCSKEFSFSGFKTSILNLINNKKEVDKIKIASSSLK